VPSLGRRNLTLYNENTEIQELVGNYAMLFKMLHPGWEDEAVMALAEAVVAFEADVGKLLLTFENQRVPGDIVVSV